MFRAGRQRLKATDEASLAVMGSAHLTHGLLPLGGQACPLVAVSGALEIGERGVVVLAFLGGHDAHSLRTPEAGGEVRMPLLQLLRSGLGGIVAHLLENFI